MLSYFVKHRKLEPLPGIDAAEIAVNTDKGFAHAALQFHDHRYTYSTSSSGRKPEDGN